jgi:hypothetical protein
MERDPKVSGLLRNCLLLTKREFTGQEKAQDNSCAGCSVALAPLAAAAASSLRRDPYHAQEKRRNIFSDSGVSLQK